MTTFDKSSSANQSVKTVLNGVNPLLAKGPAVAVARTDKVGPEILALKVNSLRPKKQDQDQDQAQAQEHFEADAAAVLDSTAMAWTPVAQGPDVLLAQAAASDGARTASDAAGANSGMKNIDWGVASSAPSAKSGLGSIWSGAALLGGLLVGGLGGGSSKTSSNNGPDNTLKLTVQDGLIAGAKVYRDEIAEMNLVGTTDANGQLVLSEPLRGSGVLIAVGGTNTDTGLANTLDLKIAFSNGLSASSVVTPVTTLVSALLDSGAANLAAAEMAVKQLLGLSPELNLSTYDPMSAANAGSNDALALRKAGAQIVQLASQMPDADQFFTSLAKEVKDADNWDDLVKDDVFVNGLLADQLSQLTVGERAALTETIVQDMATLGAASAANLSAVQLSAAKLSVALQNDTGTDSATQNDRITTDAKLDIFGYNSGKQEGIEMSIDGGPWIAFDPSQLTPTEGVQTIQVKVRQAGLASTQSDELSFTWVSQEAASPQLSLLDDTGTSNSDRITSNPAIKLIQGNNPDIVVGAETFKADLEYSWTGADDDYQPVPKNDAALLLSTLQGLNDGAHKLHVRANYTGLELKSNYTLLDFTLDRVATVPQDYEIRALDANGAPVKADGAETNKDPDPQDFVFSTVGAANVLIRLKQAPEAGATVTLRIDGQDFVVDANGQVMIPVAKLAGLRENDPHTIRISVIDAAGNRSHPTDFLPLENRFTVDNSAYDFKIDGKDATPEQKATLAPESDSFMQDNVTNVNLPVFVGQLDEDQKGSLVTLSIEGEIVGTITAGPSGAWRIPSTVVLKEGVDYVPVVTVTDLAGNVSVETEGALFTISTTQPDVNVGELADADNSSDEVLQRLSDLIAIDDDDFDLASLTSHYTAWLELTDVSELTSLDTGEEGDGITMFPYPIISGSATAGSGAANLFVFVTLRKTGPDVDPTDPSSTVVCAPVMADEDGNWSVQVKQLLAGDGETFTYVPYISVMDGAGNITRTTGEAFVIDRLSPVLEDMTAGLTHDEINDTGLDVEDNITNNPTPTITGQAEPGSWVRLTVGEWTAEEAVQADEDGNWSVTVDVDVLGEDGEYTYSLTVTDTAGNVSEVFEDGEAFTLDTTAPTEEEVTANLVHDEENDTGVDAEDNLTNLTSPVIEGTTEALAFVAVDVGGTFYETQADDDGAWSVTAEGLEDGEYTPLITVTDVAGNVSEEIEGETFTVDATAITEATANLVHDEENDTGVDVEDGITSNPSPVIEGETEAFAFVSVDLGGDAPYTTQADVNGLWSVQAEGLEDGDYIPLITVTDVAGNESEEIEGEPFTVKTAVEAPEVNAFGDTEGNDTGLLTDDFVTANTTPTLSGTAEEGSFVTVKVGEWESDPIEAVGGEWSVTVDELADGQYTPVITVTDLAGNVSLPVFGETFTVLTTAPAVGNLSIGLRQDDLSDTGFDAEDKLTNSAELQLEGKAPVGMRVVVELEGTVYGLEEGEEIFADAEGNWSVTITDLAEGEYTPVARLMDAVGNESVDVPGTPFTVDLTLPELESAGLKHDVTNDTGEADDDGITKNPSPVIEGETEAFAFVSVDLGGDAPYTTQADVNGLWSVQAEGLEDGDYIPLITVTDVAGNESEEIEGEPFTVDATAPADITADLVHDETNDTGADQYDNITANPSPYLEGEGESGAKVSVVLNNQTYSTTVTELGTWRVQAINLPDGLYTAVVTMTDAAGNVSEPFETEVPIQILRTAPLLDSVNLVQDETNDTGISLSDGLTNNKAPTIEGKTRALALVQMDLDGFSYEVEADEEGYFSFTPELELSDGVYTPTFKVKDLAGNERSITDGLSFTIDTQAPVVEEFMTPVYFVKNAPVNHQPLGLAHTPIPGELVEDYYGSLPEGLTIDDNFNVTGTPVVPGATWLAVTQADLAGNVATSYQQFVVVASVKTPSASITSLSADPLKASLYQGTSGDDSMTLFKSAGDFWRALDGNDTIKITSEEGLGFVAIDGGTGMDLLRLMVAGMDFDLANYNNPDASEKTIQNIEVIGMNGTDSNLSVSAKDIFELNSDAMDFSGLRHLLRVDSGTLGSGRTVSLSDLTQVGVDKGFNADGSTNANNTGLYAKYEGSYTDPTGTDHLVALLVQQGLTAFIA
jgi:hypothetical protein